LPAENGTSVLATLLAEKSWPLIPLVYWVASSFCIAFSEELSMRAYLVPRLEDLLRSKVGSVVLSSLLFSAYHIYKGTHGLTVAFLFGLVFASYFSLSRRLWPVMVAHGAWDLVSSMLGSK
jgi:membrane protease YdiL (CAAX protease family)